MVIQTNLYSLCMSTNVWWSR